MSDPVRGPATVSEAWFSLDQTGDIGGFNIYIPLRVRGSLDSGALAYALQALAVRHDGLRTTFAGTPAGTERLVWDERPPPIERLSAPTGRRRPRLLRDLLREAIFGSRPRPLRVTRVSLGRDDHLLLLSLDHSVADGWSVALILEELRSLYDASVAGERPTLEHVPAQLSDYARWEQTFVEDRSDGYWNEYLRGVNSPSLRLPSREPGKREPEAPIRAHLLSPISPSVIERLATLGRAHRATFPMVLVAGVATALARQATGEVVVGVVHANRERAEFRRTVGCVFTVLPIRVRVDPDRTFTDVLAGVASDTWAAYRHAVHMKAMKGYMSSGRRRPEPPALQLPFAMCDVTLNYLGPEAFTVARAGDPVERGGLGSDVLGLPVQQWRAWTSDSSLALARLDLDVYRADDGSIAIRLNVDTSELGSDFAYGLVRAMRDTLRRVAYRPEQRVGDLGLEGI